jgi:uncharacterized protein
MASSGLGSEMVTQFAAHRLPPAADFALVVPFTEGNRHFIFDGVSLSVCAVSEPLFQFIAHARTAGPNAAAAIPSGSDVEQVMLDTNRLFSAGLFRRPDTPPTPTLSEVAAAPITEAYLSLTNQCNLRCTYCFVPSAGKASSQVISSDVSRATIDLLLDHADRAHGLSLILWGGEPLLYFGAFQTAVRYAEEQSAKRRIPIAFATTTNATLLTPAVGEWLARHRVIVNLSIDGPPFLHDATRTYASGLGSSAMVERNVRSFVETSTRHFPECVTRARVTITSRSIAYLTEIHEYLWGLGIAVVWTKDVDWLPDGEPALIRDDDLARLDSEYARLRDRLFGDFLAGKMDRGPQLWFDLHLIYQRRQLRGCGAGCSGLSISPSGTISACYHLSADATHSLGTVDRPELEPSRRLQYAPLGVEWLRECGSCAFKYLCGGGCFAKSFNHGIQPPAVWRRQCRYVESYVMHCLRLYARLSTDLPADRGAALNRILAKAPPPAPRSLTQS